MDLNDFRLLYDFNAWANRRTLDACAALDAEKFLRDLGSSFGSVRDTLTHIYGAEWIWHERWAGRTPTGALPKPADFPDFDSIRARLSEMDATLIDYVAALQPEDLRRVVEFKTITAGVISHPLAYFLQHLANHGTYHRGQVATMLRQLGAKPTGTDMTVFYRERAAQAGA
ncbi:MAG TPA: DinB family protein [Candidatus Aquilonibacter sp.]|nr:DinB family protein [Candidatus Aquilonibacter sp.]